jgi:hypothetical protein
MSLGGYAFLEEHHVGLRFIEIGNWNGPSGADFVPAFVLCTEFLVELINDGLVAWTDGSHLNEWRSGCRLLSVLIIELL